MAAVYLAHDPRHNRKVAVKVMHRELVELISPAVPEGDPDHHQEVP